MLRLRSRSPGAISGIGALVGRDAFSIAGDAHHPARLNTVIVGETSKGRKGSAARPIERILVASDSSFADRITEGLSSGEGLIWQVRDPIYKTQKVGNVKDASYEEVLVDPGVDDKRLWVIESEFASVLRVVEREGNTLSPILRRAWDRDDLKTLVKNNPAKATGAHIVITGHITRDELLRYLDRTEVASGSANRFLWVASRRGQILPDGGAVPEQDIERIAAELRPVISWAAASRVLTRDPEASAVWHEVYGPLSDGKPGLFGAVTNRAEAQVLRLSVLYAIVDCSNAIRAEHLLAAMAVWRYCEQSAKWIFGDAIGDPTADTILSALRRSSSLTRSEISDLFGRNVSRSRLDQALALLLTHGHARTEHVATSGRPAEVWIAL